MGPFRSISMYVVGLVFAITLFESSWICVDGQANSVSFEPSRGGEYQECGNMMWLHYAVMTTWADAKARCAEDGGHLASVRDEAGRSCIATVVPSSSFPVWVGLTDRLREGVWLWEEDRHTEPTNSSSWWPGQPNGSPAIDQDCSYCVQPSGLLGDDVCTRNRSFLCQLSQGGHIPATETPGNNGVLPATSPRGTTNTSSPLMTAYTASLAPTHHSSSTSVAVAVIASVAGTLSIVLVILLIVVWTRRHRSASRVLRHRSVTKRRHHSLSKSARFNNFSYDEKAIPQMMYSMPKRESDLSCSSRKFSTTSSIEDGLSGYDRLFRQSDIRDSSASRNTSSSSLISDVYLRPYKPPARTEKGVYHQLAGLPYKHIAPKNILFGEQIGTGRFGVVWSAAWTQPGEPRKPVAVKTLREKSDKKANIAFLQEAAILGQFQHKNVVALYGVAKGEQVLMVLELMREDLCSYLRRLPSSSASVTEFLSMAVDIANGMAYLSGRGFVHRDLAARNILINEQLTCKIGDFGMAQMSADKSYKSNSGKISVRWAAVESLTSHQFSSASDVWSFGVVLFEIFDLGKRPYAFWPNERVIIEVQNGYRLPKPAHCPDDVFRLIQFCWHQNKYARPSFKDIAVQLTNKLTIGRTGVNDQ